MRNGLQWKPYFLIGSLLAPVQVTSSNSRRLGPVWRGSVWLAAALFWALSAGLGAHDIPNDITVQEFVKPEGQQLHVLLRVPLAAMADIEIPQRGPGYVDFSRVDVWLPTVASRWMDDYAELYEGDRGLTAPRTAAIRIALPSDRSFETYEAALAHVTTDPPLTNDTTLISNQPLLDVLY